MKKRKMTKKKIQRTIVSLTRRKSPKKRSVNTGFLMGNALLTIHEKPSVLKLNSVFFYISKSKNLNFVFFFVAGNTISGHLE